MLSSRQTWHQVKKPPPLYKLRNSCRCCCNLQDGQVDFGLMLCQHFPKRLQAAAKGQGNHNEAECDETLAKFYKKKATQERERKGNKGART